MRVGLRLRQGQAPKQAEGTASRKKDGSPTGGARFIVHGWRRMTTRRRVAIEVFLPPLLGGIAAVAPGIYFQPQNLLLSVAVYVAGGYYVATLPSIACAACMEGAFRLGLDPKSKSSIALSSLLGLLAGIAIVLVGAWQKNHVPAMEDFYFCAPVGIVAGALVGWIVRTLERQDERRKNRQPVAIANVLST